MSDKKLDLILSEIQHLNKRFDRLESKLEATFEQVVQNSEAITDLAKLKSDINTHDHHFSIIDKQLVNHAIEIEKLKNR